MSDVVFNKSIPITKLDDDLRIAYGWASVCTDNGQTVVDSQGDMIDISDMREAVHKFMGNRTAGEMHDKMGIGEIVDSLVIDKDVAKALGMPDNREGWFIGMKITDNDVWQKFKSGELKAFSIGGKGVREDG